MSTKKAIYLGLSTAMAVSAVTAGAAGAATKPRPKALPKAVPVMWTDLAGDANALNDQGGLSPAGPGDTATPGSVAAADVLGVKIARLDDGKVVKGITVTMTLSAPPMAGALYRITGSAVGCTTFWFQYTSTAGGTPAATLRHNCTPSDSPTATVSNTVSVPITAQAVGSSIVWTLGVKDLPSGVKVGTVLSPALGEVRAVLGAGGVSLITAPVIDQTPTQTLAYKIGQ